MLSRLERLEAADQATIKYSTANVSNPPTDAELDAQFGTASNLPSDAICIVNDSGADTTVWLCIPAGSGWFYEQLTKAV